MAADPLHWIARAEAAIPEGDAWLRAPERERLATMRFTKRRTEYLVRRFAGKAAVAAVLGLPEDEETLGRIGVLNRPTGAPYVTVDDRPAAVEISLTDRAGRAVCLVGRAARRIGVDLEIVEARSPGFVTDFLTAVEQSTVAAWAAAATDGHDAAANLIWSAKESALKVLSVGLSADTRTVEVHLPDPREPARPTTGSGWSRLTVSTETGDLPGYWRRDGSFLLTVVTAPGAELPPPVRLPRSARLAPASPVDGWVDHPIVE